MLKFLLPRRKAFTLIELLVVIAIIAILVAMLLPAVQQVREAARKSQCQDHLHNLGIAIHSYESSFKLLPSHATFGGTAVTGCSGWIVGTGLSWRYKILPQVEQKPLYDQINPANQTGGQACGGQTMLPNNIMSTQIDLFLCPSDPTPVNLNANRAGANYAAAVRARADRSHGELPTAGLANTFDMGALTRAGISMAGFVDGTSNTVLIGEVFRGKQFFHCSGNGAHANLGGCTTAANQVNRCHNWLESTGFCQVNAGVVINTTLPIGSNPRQYEGRFPINGTTSADQVSWPDTVAGGNAGGRPMSSAHPGGAQACMGDAKVRFISENVDMVALANTFSANGGESGVLNDR